MWDPKADSELYRTYCPNCGDRLIGDSEKGEQVCQACGYVAAGGRGRGPEWKAIDLEEKSKRVRVGSPTTLTLHDLGPLHRHRDGHARLPRQVPRPDDARHRGEDEEVAEPCQDDQQPGEGPLDSAREDHRGLRQPQPPQQRRGDRGPHLQDLGQAQGREEQVDNGDDRGHGLPRVQEVRREQDPQGGRQGGRDREGLGREILQADTQGRREGVRPSRLRGEAHLEARQPREDRPARRAPRAAPLAHDQRLQDLERQGTRGARGRLRLHVLA